MPIGRFDEGHTPVARRSENRHARGAEPLASGVNVVDLEREVTEEASRAVRLFLVPVVRKLDLPRVTGGARRQEDEREPSRSGLAPAYFAQPELVHEKVDGRLE